MATATGAPLSELLRPGDTVLVGTGTGEPVALIDELIDAAARVPGLHAIQVMTGGEERLAQVAGDRLRLSVPVPGPRTRRALAEGRAALIETSMCGLAGAIADGSLRVDAVLMQGRALGGGRASPGLIADLVIPAWTRARVRALELNLRLPAIASATSLDESDAQRVVRVARDPTEWPAEPCGEAAARIGEAVAAVVPDGATIELGVGRALAGVTAALAATRRGLAMHTGIIGDAAMALIEAGCVSRAVRGAALAVGATAMGSRAFYAWADGEPRIALVDSRLAHDARALAALPRFVAINSGLQVDLLGNVNSTVHRGRRISGPGGAPDFAAAGARGAGSIVALLSTTPDGRSAIVREAEAITVPGAHVTHVVTEHGAACLVGLSAHERAGAIAAVADPAFRDALSG